MRPKVKYLDKEMPKLKKFAKGDWIDVRASRVEVNGQEVPFQLAEVVTDVIEIEPNVFKYVTEEKMIVPYSAGDDVKVYLGFAMQLPEGKESYTAPRSSTFKNFGLIQVNSWGVVDESYNGDQDEWFIPYFALKDGFIEQYSRIGQFRIVDKMSSELTEFEEVEVLGNENRGGHGSTGTK